MSQKDGRDHNKYMESYVYWHYVYTNAHLYSKTDDFNKIQDYLFELEDNISFSQNRLHYFMKLVCLEKLKKIVPVFSDGFLDIFNAQIDSEFRKLSESELRALCGLYEIMMSYDFYPWDFKIQKFGKVAVEKIINDEIPNFPFPHPLTDNSFKLLLSSISKSEIDMCVDRNIIDEYKLSKVSVDIDIFDDGYDAKKAVKHFVNELKIAEVIKSILEEGKVDSLELSNYNKIFINNIKFPFDVKGNLSRSIGLYLWEEKFFSNKRLDDEEVVNSFLKSDFYKIINNIPFKKNKKNKFIGDVDSSDILKWLRKTEKCIENKEVRTFK